ncbi:MAG: 16S rRNA (uracil(1498)-N(3))-methyltransferase [Clostridia bacterium]|nr:16S rRNA (uracil(1498)-N(3))-methyltransferase [Clostridia bacterium]
MPRFFIRGEQVTEDNGQKIITINGDDAHHISRSLRMAVGEKIEVCDMQKNVYSCTLSKITDTTVYASVDGEGKSDTEPKHYIKLYQALSKGDKMETIIQKSVECGVCEIIPFSSERCIVKIDKKDEKKKLDRYQKIAESGAKQSGRGIIPKVEKILDFKSMLDEASKSSLPILCYEGDGTKSLKEILKENKIENDIAIIIGAEGGFSQKEVELAKEKSIHLAGLGKRILRCETAPTFALSCIAYETEL